MKGKCGEGGPTEERAFFLFFGGVFIFVNV